MQFSALVLGTRNAKKAIELARLLRPLGVQVRTLADFSDAIEVVEDGDSFAANAALKAARQAVHLGAWVLGEDSGLMVDALDGRPGIFSARFAGPDADDEKNNLRLLEMLGGTPLEKRTARYVCHLTLADPRGEIRYDVEEYCRGRIRFEPAGRDGFGYDPLFEIPEYHRTFAQLGGAVKNVLSHRGRALRRFVAELKKS